MAITTDTRHYFGPELIPRLNKLNNYCNFDTATYSLHNVPQRSLRFGIEGDGFMGRNFVHYGTRRLTVWIVADITYIRFVVDDGNLSPTPYIGVSPLLKDDLDVGLRLLNGLSYPVRGKHCLASYSVRDD